MDSFFGFMKDTGKAFYEFVLFVVTMLTVLSLMVFSPVDTQPLVFTGVLFMGVLWVATGRLLTFISVLLVIGALANKGYFNW